MGKRKEQMEKIEDTLNRIEKILETTELPYSGSTERVTENYMQEVSDEKSVSDDDIGAARAFLQQKGKESSYTDKAFENIVRRVVLLEKEMKKKDEKIEDLKDDVKKLKEKDKYQNKKIEGELDKINGKIKHIDGKMGRITRKVKDVMNCIKSIGVIGGLLDDSVKGKDMKKELNKQANQRRRENKKYLQMKRHTGISNMEKGGY